MNNEERKNIFRDFQKLERHKITKKLAFKEFKGLRNISKYIELVMLEF